MHDLSLEELERKYDQIFKEWDKKVNDLYLTTRQIGDTNLRITLQHQSGIGAGHKELPASIGSVDGAGTLKFEIPLMLNHIKDERKILTRAEGQMKKIWEVLMQYAYSQVNPKVKYEKALCLMVNIVPETSRICDTDNRAVKHIFNIIANMRIVKDDSWQYMSYMVETKVRGTRPITEIYVIDWEKIKKDAGILNRYI